MIYIIRYPNVIVVMDGQAGSSGKGKICGYIAKEDNISISINNWSSNSGHTYVFENGDRVVTQHIPLSLVNYSTKLLIGPGALITPEILVKEIQTYNNLIGKRNIYIHPRAMIIKQRHIDYEKNKIKSGSTFKGCGAALAEKTLRDPKVELMKEYYKKLPLEIQKKIKIIDTSNIINDTNLLCGEKNILVEGGQGLDLDINYGLDYPYVTSRQCNASQLIADSGISPFLVKEIIMIIRPYPIRISNNTDIGLNLYSGDYEGAEEISWEEIKGRCNAPKHLDITEYTTVTKKIRRVFEMNWERLKYSVRINRPTQIALNFAQYIDWNAYECNKFELLPTKVKDFVKKIELETGVPVTLIGTGAKNSDIIDIRKKQKNDSL